MVKFQSMWFSLLPLCSIWVQKAENHSFTLDSDAFEYKKVNLKKSIQAKTQILYNLSPLEKGSSVPRRYEKC